MDDLDALESWAGPLLARLSPAGRRQAAMDIGRALRKSQQQRIAAQRNPDGSAFAPRKPRALQGKKLREKGGRIKRRAMFAKLRTAKLLQIDTDADGLAIGWAGRVARIARVHQEGLESEVAPGGAKYKYPVRQLLGITPAERDMIRDKLLEHLAR
jgi:phage virion morphogenesis protein